MTNAPLIEVVTGALPKTADGEALDHNCLHCQLALPIQHFIDKHPNKSREHLITEACEMVAELIGSSTHDVTDVRRLARLACDALHDHVYRKFKAFERLRQGN